MHFINDITVLLMAESDSLRGKKSADGEYVSDIILSVWGPDPGH